MSRDTSPKRQMVANAIARFAVAFALIFEHSKILADPSTYDWMVEYEAMPVFYGAGPVGRLASRAARAQRGLVRCVGVRAWCVIVCCLGAALALGRRRCRRRACAVVVAMRLCWMAVHDGNVVQPSDSYAIWAVALVAAVDSVEEATNTTQLTLSVARFSAWAALSVGMLYAGLLKLASPSWVRGDAVGLLVDAVTARPAVAGATALRAFLVRCSRPLTYAALALEVLVFPSLLFVDWDWRRRGLVAAAAFHAAVGVVVDVPWITCYMIAHAASLSAFERAMARRTPRDAAARPPLAWRGAVVVVLSGASLASVAGGALGHPCAWRRTGLVPFTPTGYERALGMPKFFEPYAFREARLTFATAPAWFPWTRAGGCPPGASEDAPCFDGAIGVRAAAAVDLAGWTKRHPATQHHQLVLNALVHPSAAAKHEFLCAGGTGYRLAEAASFRALAASQDGDVLVSARVEVAHPLDDAAVFVVEVDCQDFWRRRGGDAAFRRRLGRDARVRDRAAALRRADASLRRDRAASESARAEQVVLYSDFAPRPPEAAPRDADELLLPSLRAAAARALAPPLAWLARVAAPSESERELFSRFEALAEGRTRAVVVTGATSGVGRDAAMALYGLGHDVVAASRDRDALENVRRAARDRYPAKNNRFDVVPVDLADAAAIPAAAAALVAANPNVDAVVHAAGVAAGDARELFEVNFFGPVELTRALEDRLDRVVFVSSMAAVFPGPDQLVYAASKAALDAAADSLRREFARDASRERFVAVVAPGSVSGGESRMCPAPDVCDVPPRRATTPPILDALLAPAPRARYAAGPCSAALVEAARLRAPCAAALLLARPVPDWVLDALLRLVPHPLHNP